MLKLVLEFGRRFVNDSYQISLYLNLARLIRAEQEVNELLSEGQKLIKEVNFLMFQNAGMAVHAGVVWLRKARMNLEYRRKRQKDQEN